ncbi:pyridoxal-phosphate dependent enzyme, partial [bacterium]|nr:pyridoxal-phosphate dependent enzyme [candidate division CSSED10-310 bacterium]
GITPDHIDEHDSFDDYVRTKARLFEAVPDTGWSLLNRDDAMFGTVRRNIHSRLATFGAGPPESAFDIGIVTNSRKVSVVARHETGTEPLFQADDIRLPGPHNLMNGMAAAGAAWLMGIPATVIPDAIRSFRGVKHRIECVAEAGGVRFFDDEASTNPAATAAALDAMDRPVILICGGDMKGNDSDFQRLEPLIRRQVAHVIALPGQAGSMISNLAREAAVPVHSTRRLIDAMSIVDRLAHPGIDVLLSPAGAGFHSRFNSEAKGFRRMVRDRVRRTSAEPPVSVSPDWTPTPLDRRTITGIGPVDFKHEYCCPTGSHKDRAALYQVRCARNEQAPGVIIPSSGNAAIAVAAAGYTLGIPVYAFLSPETHPGKLAAMASFSPRIIICRNSIRRAGNAARRFGLPNLRPSRDSRAVTGFMTLGFEIMAQDPNETLTDIFLFTTSGATLTGIIRAFLHAVSHGTRSRIPRFHAVQSGSAIDIARALDSRPVPSTPADCRSAGFGGVSGSLLNDELIHVIRAHGGSGWYTTESEWQEADTWLQAAGIETSPEGGAALAALVRWRNSSRTQPDDRPLVILTGRRYSDTIDPPDLSGCDVCRSETYGGIETFMSQWHTVVS